MGVEAEETTTMASKMALVLAAKSKALLSTTSPASPNNMFASPIHTLASVPFCWEEEPGKPKLPLLPHPYHHKCLDLPPRLLLPTDFTKMPLSASGRKGLWGFREKKGKGDAVRGSYVFPSCADSSRKSERGEGCGGIIIDNTYGTKITRSDRDSSLYSLSAHRSHFWANIYKGFKRVVQRKTKKLRREGF